MTKIIRTANDIQIPAIAPKKKKAELTDRQEWQRLYSYWLTRKNNLGLKLSEKGRPTETNERYQQLNEKVQEYWQLLHDSRPIYKLL